MPPWYFQMPDLLLQIVRCELVISRILNRWKAKILLVLEEAMVELICFLLRSSCLQHPSRTMGARGLWMKQPVFSWFLRISACFTRKDLWIPTYNYWNPLAQLGTMNAVVWLCDFTRVNNIDLETFGSTYVVNYSVYYLLYFIIIIIIWYRSSSTLFLEVHLEPAVSGNQAIYWNVSKWYCWCVASGDASVEWECWPSSKKHKKVLLRKLEDCF